MLQLRELQKTFFAGSPNEVRALRNVSLQIDDGSFVTVIDTNAPIVSPLIVCLMPNCNVARPIGAVNTTKRNASILRTRAANGRATGRRAIDLARGRR